TNAGTYTDAWTFTDATGNYNNDSGTVSDLIKKADAHITVTPYSVPYDGTAHSAASSATGVEGPTPADPSAPRPASSTHSNAGTYSDSCSFDGNTNYNSVASTPITDSISQVGSTTTVTASNATHDGSAHGGTASWASTGADGEGAALT